MENWRKRSMLNNLKALLLIRKKIKFTSWRNPYMVWNKLFVPGTLNLTTTSLKMVSLEVRVSLPSMWKAKVIPKSLLLLFMLMILFLLEMMRRWLKKLRNEMMKKIWNEWYGIVALFFRNWSLSRRRWSVYLPKEVCLTYP